MSDLTTRLLAEIERREGVVATALAHGLNFRISGEGGHDFDSEEQADAITEYLQGVSPRRVLAYLGVMRVIAELHRPDPDEPRWCVLCGVADGKWPCLTLLAVMDALGVATDDESRRPTSTESDADGSSAPTCQPGHDNTAETK